jgi:hypothetical protein
MAYTFFLLQNASYPGASYNTIFQDLTRNLLVRLSVCRPAESVLMFTLLTLST